MKTQLLKKIKTENMIAEEMHGFFGGSASMENTCCNCCCTKTGGRYLCCA